MSAQTNDPLTRRLRQMTKDAANAVAGSLVLYTGLRESKKPRRILKQEINTLRQQIEQVAAAALEVDEFLEILEAKASETSETELIAIVEKLSDSVMISEGVANVGRMDYITCAQKVLALATDRIALSVKEVASYPGGKGQLELWRDEIEKVLE